MSAEKQLARQNTPVEIAIRALEKSKPRLEQLLPPGYQSARLIAIARTEIRKNEALAAVPTGQLLAAVANAMSLGLEFGPAKEVYLVPYLGRRQTVEAIAGYAGLLKLAYQSCAITRFAARIVRAGDEFSFQYGISEDIRHVPVADIGAEVTHVYAVAWHEAGGASFAVMTKGEVDRIRTRNPNESNSSPWKSDYEEMAKKTVLRRLVKYLPRAYSRQGFGALDRAIAAEERDQGDGAIDAESVITPEAAAEIDESAAPKEEHRMAMPGVK